MTQQPGQGPGPYRPQGPTGPQGPGPQPYGAQPPQYGQPQPGYGAQPPQYGAPTPPQPYPPGPQPYGSPQGGQAGQPPYGSQPSFAQPQQPSYTPPQTPYGAPGQPGPSPYGQTPPAYSPQGWSGGPPQPPTKSRAGLVVGIIALVVVLAGGAGLWLALRPKTTTGTTTTATTAATKAATTTATKATTTTATKAATTAATKATATGATTCTGGTITADDYTAKVPTGWECSQEKGSVVLTDSSFDTVMVVQMPGMTDAAKVCSSLASAGKLTELPDTQWGGKAAKTEELASGSSKMHVRCVASGGSVYYLMAIPITGSYEDVVAGVDALTGGWTWK